MQSIKALLNLKHSFQTIVVHSFLGRPTRLPYFEVAGSKPPGINARLRNGSEGEDRATLPYNNICCCSNCLSRDLCPDSWSTIMFDTLDTKAGCTLNMTRRQRQWKQQSRRMSATLSHAELNPYSSRLTTTDWNTRSLRDRVREVCFHRRFSLVKSPQAAPSFRFSSLLRAPSA